MPSDSLSKSDIITVEGARTLPGLFRERVRRSPAGLAYRQFDAKLDRWTEHTWSQMARRVASFREGLRKTGLQAGDRVAFLLPNGTDWVALDIAAMSNGLVCIPLYMHDSAKNVADIIADSGARLCVIDATDRWQALVPFVSEQPQLEHVWIREGAESALCVSGGGPAVVPLASVLGEPSCDIEDATCEPGYLATIIYTSGTTGRPKGVMLSHSAILWNAQAITKFIPPLTTDVFLSILPLAHAFERTIGYYLPMLAGSTVAYVRSTGTLREDLATIRPTVLIAVPRIYERMHAAILAEADRNPLKRALVDLTARIGWETFQAQRHRGPPRSIPAWLVWPALKRLVARRSMAAFGGRLRVAVSGGAALPGDVARFLVGMGLPLVEGYGLTEAAPVVTVTTLEDSLPGSVGWPLPGLEVRLGDDDELLIRSPAVMLGYWRNPEATSKTLDEEGWLRTGDIARLQEGRVYIGGRLAETIVLSTGEKISPTVVEDCILRDRLFEQVCVIGSGRPCLSVLIVLNEARWQSLAAALNVDPHSANASEATQAVLERLNALLADMPKHGIVRAVHLMLEPWTIQDGLLTPTLKLKRKAIEHRFRDEIAALYEQLGRNARRDMDANGGTGPGKPLHNSRPSNAR